MDALTRHGMWRPPAGRGQRENGQELVEFALVAPLLLLMMLAVIEFGFIVHSYNVVANVAREGARAGVVPSATEAKITDAALAVTSGLDSASLSLAVDLGNDTVRVDVAYDHQLLTGPIIEMFGGNPTVHLGASSTMNRE